MAKQKAKAKPKTKPKRPRKTLIDVSNTPVVTPIDSFTPRELDDPGEVDEKTNDDTRNGILAETGQLIKSCICVRSEECKRLMTDWTTIDPSRCGHIRLPKHNEKDTPIAKYINGFRKAVKKTSFRKRYEGALH
jgi:hypothetical protein